MKGTKNWKTFSLGAIAISSITCLAALLQEYIIKTSYTNLQTDFEEKMSIPNFFVLVTALVSWGLAAGLNRKQKINQNRSQLFQAKPLLLEAILTFVSVFTFTKAIYLTGCPTAIMFKGCSIVSLTAMGVFVLSREQQHKSNINKNLVTSIFVGLGIILFCLGGSQKNQINSIGIQLLLISLLCDGILQKFQHNNSNPTTSDLSPVEKFQQVSKCVAAVSLLYAICTGQILDMAEFVMDHPVGLVHLVFFGFLGAASKIVGFEICQLYSARTMDFLGSIRQLVSVILSIIIFKHQAVSLQFIAIFGVAGVLTDNFLQIEKKQKFKKKYSDLNKYSVSLLDEPFDADEGTIFKVELEVPAQSLQQRQWRQRYDMMKLVQEIYPPENVIEFVERESVKELTKGNSQVMFEDKNDFETVLNVENETILDPEHEEMTKQQINSNEEIKQDEQHGENNSTDSSKD